ncbi:uncharacterized protein METZ01_LOCUS323522 [marine metagenome]|uniref:Uncharacterized protein n=1 Tax=marine metagenome TaxID=408172 RepID=A0A382PD68_9ZZZZ
MTSVNCLFRNAQTGGGVIAVTSMVGMSVYYQYHSA